MQPKQWTCVLYSAMCLHPIYKSNMFGNRMHVLFLKVQARCDTGNQTVFLQAGIVLLTWTLLRLLPTVQLYKV